MTRTFQNLPGTDPRFHEPRKYLSPIHYRGEKILASHASCKETGCNFSKAWTSNVARDLGAWRHRSEMVKEARLEYFAKITKNNSLLSAEYFLETADKNSHRFDNWKDIVRSYIHTIAGVGEGEVDISENTLQTYYHVGTMAKVMARQLLNAAYDS